MKNQRISGYLMVIAAAGFWVSWFLMPDAGTKDTIHILSVVKQTRMNVWFSVMTQIATSIVYMTGLILLARSNFKMDKTTFTGMLLFGIGILGLCSDAFFHLLAYFMTDSSVNVQNDVIRVMYLMQTTGVGFLILILLPFFIGSLLLSIGLNRGAIISKTAWILIVTAFSIGVINAIEMKTHIAKPTPVIIILGIFSIGQAFIGFELINPLKRPKSMVEVFIF
jgi:hypothetical protein